MAGSYGSWTMTAGGAWTCLETSRLPAIQQLGSGQSLVDSFTAVSLDGSASRLVSVTLNGSNDVAAIEGGRAGRRGKGENSVGGGPVKKRKHDNQGAEHDTTRQ